MIIVQDIGVNILLWAAILGCIILPRMPRVMRVIGLILALAGMPALPFLSWHLFEGAGSIETGPSDKTFIAVFGGGASRIPEIGAWPESDTVLRVAAGLSAAQESGLPIAFSGGATKDGAPTEADAVRRSLNWPDNAPMDDNARNTKENAEAFAKIAAQQGWTHVVLATGPTHRRRAAATLRAAGLTLAGVAETSRERPTLSALFFVPSLKGLALWRRPTYETAAIASYLAAGRIAWRDLF